MNFDIRTVDLQRLNSLTKYPSILTYHNLDPKNGNLLEEPRLFQGNLIATEKVDGTNSRIICLPDGSYLLGSREELLYAKGDLIGNPALGIVDALKDKAEEIATLSENKIKIFFFEVYGGKITQASKQYTVNRKVGYRLIDIGEIPDYDALLQKSPSELSRWRDSGG